MIGSITRNPERSLVTNRNDLINRRVARSRPPLTSRPTRVEFSAGSRAPLDRDVPAPVLHVPGAARDLQVKFASDRQEWEEAFRLVAANYRARGYEAPSSRPLRFTPYHALPGTQTLVAKHAGHVVATFSIVLDNTLLGLPMESTYGAEVAALRDQGYRLMETTSLAETGLGVREFLRVFMALIRLAMQFHTAHGGDAYVITVNPRHKGFYSKVLGFLPLGPCRAYACMQDAPAEALWVSNDLLRERAPRAYAEVFGEPQPEAALRPRRMPRDLVRYFGQQSSPGDGATLDAALSFLDRHGNARRW
jgi:hypothetical protein